MPRSLRFPALCALSLAVASCLFGGGAPSGGGTPPPRTREPAHAESATPTQDAAQVVEADAALAGARASEQPLSAAEPRGADDPAGNSAGGTSGAPEPEREFEGEGLAFERGAGMAAVWVPKAEHLEFDVLVDLPLVGKVVAGQVVLEARVEHYVAGLPLAGAAQDRPHEWMGTICSIATGSALGYSLHEELKSRLLPQAFPRLFYTDTQTGTENRKKELKLGTQDDKFVDDYRNDTHCKGCNNREHFVDSNWLWGKPSHCDGCKRAEHRIWRDFKKRDVPQGSLDMLSAVYLARTMVREGRAEESLSMVDELKLWNVQLSQGVKKRIEVPAGRFDCVEVRLKSSVPAGEPAPKDGFEGLFGLKGTIQVWMDARFGVPVQIQGAFPIKLLSSNLDVYVVLKGFRGAPKGFAPVP